MQLVRLLQDPHEEEINQFRKRRLPFAAKHVQSFLNCREGGEKITWTFNGTTQDINAALTGLQQALDAVPELAQKVEKGVIK